MKKIAQNLTSSALRVVKTSRVLVSHGVRWWLTYKREGATHAETARLMRSAFEDMGSTYIKLGQFIASSPSIFPEEYILEFQKCLDQAKPFPYSVIEAEIERGLGVKTKEVFSHIDKKPLASASIAQVHAARLNTGEDVVIKVLKPGVRQTILTDMTFIHVCSRLAEFVMPHLEMTSIGNIAEDIRASMLEECDFRLEVRNMEAFRKFLKENHLDSRVVVPKVYSHACAANVLTMERLYGEPVTTVENVRKYAKKPHMVLREAMQTWFLSLYACESFHADIHAGNLLILTDGRIAFIDFGIVGRLAPGTWDALKSFGLAIPQGDYKTMAEAMQVVGITEKKVDAVALENDIESFIKRADAIQNMDYMSPVMMLDAELDKLLIDFVNIGKKHGIHFPRQFGLLVKQLLYFDRFRHVFKVDVMLEDFLEMGLEGDMFPGEVGNFKFS